MLGVENVREADGLREILGTKLMHAELYGITARERMLKMLLYVYENPTSFELVPSTYACYLIPKRHCLRFQETGCIFGQIW